MKSWSPCLSLVAVLVTVSSVVTAAQFGTRVERVSANPGDADEQFDMAKRHYAGRGVPQDIAEAIRWYQLAAEQGHAGAQANLATLYAGGLGIQRDLVQAYMWLTLSAAGSTGQPREAAIRTRDTVSADMTPEQIKEAERLSAEWMPTTQIKEAERLSAEWMPTTNNPPPRLAGFRYIQNLGVRVVAGPGEDEVQLTRYFGQELIKRGWQIRPPTDFFTSLENREIASQTLRCAIEIDAGGWGTGAYLNCDDLLLENLAAFEERGVAITKGGEYRKAIRKAVERLHKMRPRFEEGQVSDIVSRLPAVDMHPLTEVELDQMILDGRLNSAIEGLWAATDDSGFRLGIVAGDDGNEFVVVVLESAVPYYWPPGMVIARFTMAADGRNFMGTVLGFNHVEATGFAGLTNGMLTISMGAANNRDTFSFLKLRPSLVGGAPSRSPIPTDSTGLPNVVTSTGTAFFVDPSGVLLTAHHVVDRATSITVSCDGRAPVIATVTSSSPAVDLAVLTAVGDLGTNTYLALSPTQQPALGDDVFTIGYPTPGILGRDPKYTNGTVSALSGVEGDASFLQISVPVQPGNSGGPLVNEQGEVIGVVVATADAPTFIRATDSIPQNINWAVKSVFASALFTPPTGRMPSIDPDEVIQYVTEATCLVEATRPAR